MSERRVLQSGSAVPRSGDGGPGRVRKLLAALLAVSLSLVFAGASRTAHAALQEKDRVTLTDTWNPRPDPEPGRDIILPMPHGLSMAFRVVAVPGTGLLNRRTMKMGVRNFPDAGGGSGLPPERVYYDSQYSAGLSAPFTGKDIPKDWKRSLPPEANVGDYSYYLIAKYEVSRMQWKAVMDAEPPDIFSPDPSDARPVTDISWHDAVRFTERYTEWLLKNHPEALPRFAGDSRNTGFVRLPTEAEWEYAARGGQMEENRSQDFFSMEKGRRLSDYAVCREENSSHNPEGLARIGSRLPNPLGLYDTAGNAAEMTADFFRFSLGGELLGSAGGFVCKGGSFHSGREGVMPGRREELSPFLKNGSQRNSDLGFRPVVSGINTPGGGRSAVLQAESAGYGGLTPRITEPEAADTPLRELDRLISQQKNETVKENLRVVRNRAAQNNDRKKEADGSGRESAPQGNTSGQPGWPPATVFLLLLAGSLLFWSVVRWKGGKAQAAATPLAELDRLIEKEKSGKIRQNLLALRAQLVRQVTGLQNGFGQSDVKGSPDQAGQAQEAPFFRLLNCLLTLEEIRRCVFRIADVQQQVDLLSAVTGQAGETPAGKEPDDCQALLSGHRQDLAGLEREQGEAVHCYMQEMKSLLSLDPGAVAVAGQLLASGCAGDAASMGRLNRDLALIAGHHARALEGNLSEEGVIEDVRKIELENFRDFSPLFSSAVLPAVARPQAAATPLEELDRLINEEKDGKIRENLLALRKRIRESEERIARLVSELKTCSSKLARSTGRSLSPVPDERTLRLVSRLEDRSRALDACRKQLREYQGHFNCARMETRVQHCLLLLEAISHFRDMYECDETLLQNANFILSLPQGKIGSLRASGYRKLVADLKQELTAFEQKLNTTLRLYSNAMRDIIIRNRNEVNEARTSLAERYQGDDAFSQSMAGKLALFSRHYGQMAKGGRLDSNTILSDVIHLNG